MIVNEAHKRKGEESFTSNEKIGGDRPRQL